jgi:hypothetical protein
MYDRTWRGGADGISISLYGSVTGWVIDIKRSVDGDDNDWV